eukprot:TRINITY_DN2452_c0_g1_i4.p1 TRINITY_DN2452_c0_g1~~TRINITY_DN2452_c0_g1_i4.p1  ORF type:complete len:148 (+),score=22.06 TRINITY_DN2452_c0_g1_i4:988-1431(+)
MGDTLSQTSFYPAAVPAGVVFLLEGGNEPPPSSVSPQAFSTVLCLRTLPHLSVNSPTEGLLRILWKFILSVFPSPSTSLIGRLKAFFCLDTDPREGSVVLFVHPGPTEGPELLLPLLLTGPTRGPVSFEYIIPTNYFNNFSHTTHHQ